MRAVRATGPILAGTVVAVFGGRIIDVATLRDLTVREHRYVIQVDEGLYQLSMAPGPAEEINHSCAPNLGFRGQVSLVAMRDIEAGEEITFDYAMCDGSSFDQFMCRCGAARCRGRVTGDDWRRPELWRAYGGYFSPYLADRILRLRSESERSRTAINGALRR